MRLRFRLLIPALALCAAVPTAHAETVASVESPGKVLRFELDLHEGRLGYRVQRLVSEVPKLDLAERGGIVAGLPGGRMRSAARVVAPCSHLVDAGAGGSDEVGGEDRLRYAEKPVGVVGAAGVGGACHA